MADGTLIRAPVLRPVAAEDLPDVCPPGPLYLRLGDVARIEKGKTGIASALPGPYPLVVTAQDRASCDHFDIDAAAAIVPLVSSAGHGKASLQRLHYQEGKFALGTILAAVIPHAPDLVSARFVFEYLTAFKDELLVSQMIGTANVTLTIGKVANTPFPLLARTVQRRVEELMALCDRLEAARAEREAARDRLTAASLARLNTPNPETFDEDTRFALAALPSLSTHSEQMDSLRQAIRNLGVQGKLTRQDVDEEPGAVLLAKIAEAKAKLISRRGVRSATSVSSAGAGIGIDLPPGWAVARWEDIALKIGDIDHKMPDQVTEGIPYVSPRDFGPGNSINFEGAKRISRADFDRLAKKIRPEVGDIIFPRYGTIGENRLVDDAREFLASYSCCVIKVLHGFVDPGFQYLYSISDVCRAQARAAENKTTQANVGIQSIKDFLVPLPPLAEQRRIVLRVNQLMTVCDQLEASLAASAAHRARLLEALLRSALESTNAERHAGATESQAA